MITEKLDRIASDLESKGLLREAADIDAVSNALDATTGANEKDIELSAEQKSKIIANYDRVAKDLKMKFKDVQVIGFGGGYPAKYRVILYGEGEPIEISDLRRYDTPGMNFSLESFSEIVNENELKTTYGVNL